MSLTVVHAWQLPSFDDGIDDIDRALLNHIHNGELVLPDLQRDFVWREADIRLLLDSILRDYPFGSLLLWNTQYLAVPYREFVKDSTTGQTFTTQEKGVGTKLRMVLDGQQRLQSLYIAIRGTYDGKRLYFNVTSGPDGEAQDGEEGRPYKFEFWQDDEVSRPKRLLRVADIISWPERQADASMAIAVAAAGLVDLEARLAERNIRLLRSAIHRSDLVPVVTIDDEVQNASQARSLEEILDIFVRVNSGGTRLTGSELMFSLIKAKWSSARKEFDELIGRVGQKAQLPVDKDFVIRGLLTVADASPKFEVANVKRHWAEMLSRFEAFDASLANAIDFCRASDGARMPIACVHSASHALSRRLLPLSKVLLRSPRQSESRSADVDLVPSLQRFLGRQESRSTHSLPPRGLSARTRGHAATLDAPGRRPRASKGTLGVNDA